MKKYILFSFLIFPMLFHAQSLSYSDGAILFSQDDQYGTARYMGMSGAFGALGGDMAAVEVNPAGLAVYTRSDFEATMGYRNTSTKSSWYGTGINSTDDSFRFTQAGGAMVFNTHNGSDFKKFSIGFNYSLIKDFNNSFFVRGNSGVPDFVDDPYLNYDGNDNNNIYYVNVDDQYFANYMSGIHDRFTFSFASQYKDFLSFGLALKTHVVNFGQTANYEEYNNDGHGNLLDAYLSQYLSVYGTGFDFSLGVIFKPIHNFRIGLAYQSPVWLNVSERFNENLQIDVSNNPDPYTEYYDPNYFDYSINTPSKFTGSLAYIFGTHGLISFDYIYRDYNNLSLKPTGEFIDENNEMSRYLQGTSNFRFGTEWRVKYFSFRGGYRFEQTPFRDASGSNDLTGYSFGLGIKFNSLFRLDLAYDSYKYSYQYSFLNIDGVVPATIDESTYRLTGSLIFSF